MLNKEYIRDILLNILSLKNIDNISLFISGNEKKNLNDLDFYTIYIHSVLKNKYLDFELVNIYPLSHTIESKNFYYNNLSEDEVSTLISLLSLIDIKVNKISKSDLLSKINAANIVIDKAQKKVYDLKQNINSLCNADNTNLYLLEKKLDSILGDFKKINIVA